MSTVGAMSGTLATIFSLEKSRKWIIREGGNGIDWTGSGAPMASGLRKSRGLRITFNPTGGWGITRVVTRRVIGLTLVVVAMFAVPSSAGVAHRWPVVVPGPGPLDITVSVVDFHAAGRPALGLSLRRKVAGEYVAAARLRHPPQGQAVALVLVVDRRPAARFMARLSRAAHAPRVRSAVDAFKSGRTGPAALCGMFEGTMAGGDLRAIMRSGTPLHGFGAAAAVAQGFDQACGRTVEPAFVSAVRGPVQAPVPAPPTPTTPTSPTMPTAPTTPTPTRPPLPGCPPGPIAAELMICPLQNG